MGKLVPCKECGHEISESAKVCPNCGAKVKKPVYKRWGFWVLMLVLFLILMPKNSTGSSDKTTKPEQPVSQSAQSAETAASGSAEKVIPQKEKQDTPVNAGSESSAAGTSTEIPGAWTTAQKNVMASAKAYLNYSGFSYDGLVDQLEYEKYSHEDAVWAADNCNADWNEEALESAKSYIDYSGFSYSGLIGQLEYEGFTTEQATYGADNCGADWNEEAAESAKSYLSFTSFSRQGLIDQLLYEGFTQEQAEYGVSQNGY